MKEKVVSYRSFDERIKEGLSTLSAGEALLLSAYHRSKGRKFEYILFDKKEPAYQPLTLGEVQKVVSMLRSENVRKIHVLAHPETLNFLSLLMMCQDVVIDECKLSSSFNSTIQSRVFTVRFIYRRKEK